MRRGTSTRLTLLSALAAALVLCILVRPSGAAEPLPRCREQGNCKKATQAKVVGLEFEYFPQIRQFMASHLQHWSEVSWDRRSIKSPIIEFYDGSGQVVETVHIDGMFAREMEEELEARGLVKEA